MENKEVNGRMVDTLTRIIVQFDNEKWLKMATRKDLATYIIDKGFCPSTSVSRYQQGIREILEIIKDYRDEEYNIIEEDGIDKLIDKIYSLIGEK